MMSAFMKILAVLSILASIPPIESAYSWTGKVVGVSDGDTITVLAPDKKEMKIRLYGVDCPEKSQDFGTKAKQFTSEKAFGQTVDVDPVTIDRYGRTIGIVNVNGTNLSKMLIESGMAWVYEEYCKMSECNDWRGLQVKAKSQKTGIWSMSNPTPPWAFRHSEEGRKTALEESSSSGGYSSKSIHSYSSPTFGGGSNPKSSGGQTWVDPYTRKDGITVQGHYRSNHK